eukprot:1157694-Pelagomonas_calceolata.AAC.2
MPNADQHAADIQPQCYSILGSAAVGVLHSSPGYMHLVEAERFAYSFACSRAPEHPLQSEIESQPDVDAALIGVACKIAASAAEKEQQRQKGGGGAGLAALDLASLQVVGLVGSLVTRWSCCRSNGFIERPLACKNVTPWDFAHTCHACLRAVFLQSCWNVLVLHASFTQECMPTLDTGVMPGGHARVRGAMPQASHSAVLAGADRENDEHGGCLLRPVWCFVRGSCCSQQKVLAGSPQSFTKLATTHGCNSLRAGSGHAKCAAKCLLPAGPHRQAPMSASHSCLSCRR